MLINIIQHVRGGQRDTPNAFRSLESAETFWRECYKSMDRVCSITTGNRITENESIGLGAMTDGEYGEWFWDLVELA